jgi:hypothetical protein
MSEIPALFATIHHRGGNRPEGYSEQEISWLNVVANRHLPDLYARLMAEHRRLYPASAFDERVHRLAMEELKSLATAYDYPRVRLVQSYQDQASALPAFRERGLYFVPAKSAEPYPIFERTISDDLRSGDEARVSLGLASVIFWGHYSDGNANRAAFRANKTAAAGSELLEDVAAIIALVDSGSFGEALVRAFALPEIGSTSFASKIVTFLAPQNAGVFDLQIYEGLARTMLASDRSLIQDWLAVEFAPWAWTAYGNKATKVRTARGYDRWCARLTEVSNDLNAAGVQGPWGIWRAADVERAIYRALRNRRGGKAD